MSPADRELDALLEAAASAWRERNVHGRILPSPGWMDLSPADREALFDLQRESRLVERLASRDGLDATVRAVLRRIRG